MPAASAGNVLFSKLVAFKEATPGTIPTLTSGGRKLLVSPTGVISDGTTIELEPSDPLRFATRSSQRLAPSSPLSQH